VGIAHLTFTQGSKSCCGCWRSDVQEPVSYRRAIELLVRRYARAAVAGTSGDAKIRPSYVEGQMMLTDNEITIQVPADVAEMYHQSTIAECQQMAEQIGIIFSVFNKSGSADLTGFRNTLLDLIERSNPQYQTEMTDALQGGFLEDRPTMSADEFGAWLADV
jgi:hypothetical protein